MLSCATANDAKTLIKAEREKDLDRYTSRTIGMYKAAVKELERKKNREKRAALKASGEEAGEKPKPKPKAKSTVSSNGDTAATGKV